MARDWRAVPATGDRYGEGMILPVSRTTAEAHLYLELHGCECGEPAFAPESAIVVLADGDLGQRYSGTCPGCGAEREFVFRLPQEPTLPSSSGFAFGGAQPSELIDPGEWLLVADSYAKQAPGAVGEITGEQAQRAAVLLERAVAALDEVLKFVPDAADEVPPVAFFTVRGRDLHRRTPGRFRRDRLVAVRETCAGLLQQVAARPV